MGNYVHTVHGIFFSQFKHSDLNIWGEVTKLYLWDQRVAFMLCGFSIHNAYLSSLSCLITHNRIYRPERNTSENGHQKEGIPGLTIRDDVISANLHQIISKMFLLIRKDLFLYFLKSLYRIGITSSFNVL